MLALAGFKGMADRLRCRYQAKILCPNLAGLDDAPATAKLVDEKNALGGVLFAIHQVCPEKREAFSSMRPVIRDSNPNIQNGENCVDPALFFRGDCWLFAKG